MKRSSLPGSLLDCQTIGSSLKRIKISTSPGELRLDRDLSSLAREHCWMKQGEKRWVRPDGQVCLERTTDPLRLRLMMEDLGIVWIQIPRLYPHSPPVVSRMILHRHSILERIVISTTPPNEDAFSLHSGTTAVYSNWSAISELVDLIDFVMQLLQQQRNDISNGSVASFSMNGTGQSSTNALLVGDIHDDDAMEDQTSMPRREPLKIANSLFNPNRFDVGYKRSSNGLHRCHSESSLPPRNSQISPTKNLGMDWDMEKWSTQTRTRRAEAPSGEAMMEC